MSKEKELQKDHEALQVTRFLRIAYPGFFHEIATSDAMMLFETWKKALEGYEYSMIKNAIADYLRTDTKGFPPTPGQIIQRINKELSDTMFEINEDK